MNFDGFNDVLLATSRGVANTYADYWLFVGATGEFSYLGNYPLFVPEEGRGPGRVVEVRRMAYCLRRSPRTWGGGERVKRVVAPCSGTPQICPRGAGG